MKRKKKKKMNIKMTSDTKNRLIGLRDGMLEQIRRAAMDDGTSVWASPIFLKPEDVLKTIDEFGQSILNKLSRRNNDVFGHDDIKVLLACLATLISLELTIAELERYELDGQKICGIMKHIGLGVKK